MNANVFTFGEKFLAAFQKQKVAREQREAAQAARAEQANGADMVVWRLVIDETTGRWDTTTNNTIYYVSWGSARDLTGDPNIGGAVIDA